jgi:hydrogenase nickel incorporation protein HypA/HybF
MHELSVTESILHIATEHAQKASAQKVTAVFLVLGRLSSIVDDSVQFYWDALSEGTICEGAQLHFQRIPAKLLCLDCGMTYEIDRDLTPCPGCAGNRIKVVAGDEFRVDSIEVVKSE